LIASKQRLQTLLTTEQYQEVRPLMLTTYERGKMAMAVEMTLLQLEEKFGPLAPEIKTRVQALIPQELRRLALDLIKAQSLKELGLLE
jgi:hypothetical protein